MTNNDRLNAMSVEEKIKFFVVGCSVCIGFDRETLSQNCDGIECAKGIKQWLESEAEN